MARKALLVFGFVLAVSALVGQSPFDAARAQDSSGQDENALPPQARAPQKAGDEQKDPDNAGRSPKDQEALKKPLTASAPVLEIKRLESERPLYSIELRDVPLADLFRVIAHDYNLNIIIDPQTEGTITASFTNIALDEALDSIAEMSNLILERKGSIIKVSPNLITKTVILKYVSAKKLLESSAAGSAQAGVNSGATASAAGQSATPTASTDNSIYSLLSARGKILLGQQQNSLTIIDYPEQVKKISDYLKNIDQGLTTRVFKLKYLKADEVTGVTQVMSTTTQTTTATGTTSETKTTATKQQ